MLLKMQLTTKYLLVLPIYVFTALVVAAEKNLDISGSITATGQTTNDDNIADEVQASADLAGELSLGTGSLNFHVEGSTTPKTKGISALVGEANGDVGSTLDDEDNGRLQVSELFYSIPLGGPTLSIGLLDPTASLDTDAVANDENTQFLAGPLINNATIGFPDYTLGFTIDEEPENAGIGYHLFVGSSHGLADNVDRDYSDLFHLNDDDKGVFVATEGVWKTPDITTRCGIWVNSGDFVKLENESDTSHNWGVYGGLNAPVGAGTWGLRAGWADPSVSAANWTISAAVEYPVYTATTAGFGLAHTAASSDLGPGYDDNLLAELYMRFELDTHLHITPVFQYVHNPGFDSTEEVIDQNQWIAGLRLHIPF